MSKVKEFAESHKGRNYSPEPSRWLADDCFEQSSEDWSDWTENDAGDDWGHVFEVVRKHFQPDIRDVSAVKSRLDESQFKAADLTGFRRIADADKFDKATPEAYRKHRKAVSA